MLKKRIAVLGIAMFTVSLFPWNATATEVTTNNTPTKNCVKVTDQAKADQASPTAEKKPTKRKG